METTIGILSFFEVGAPLDCPAVAKRPGELFALYQHNLDLSNEPSPFKSLNIRIPVIIPIKGRGYIN